MIDHAYVSLYLFDLDKPHLKKLPVEKLNKQLWHYIIFNNTSASQITGLLQRILTLRERKSATKNIVNFKRLMLKPDKGIEWL
jgi:hypothetical protein